MKNKQMKCIIYFLVLGAETFSFNLHGTAQSTPQSNQDRIITYPVPSGEKASTGYSVQINGLPVQAFLAQVDDRYKAGAYNFGDTYPFIQFDFSGLAEIKIHAPGRSLSKTVVRPQSKGITPEIIDENTIVLTLTEPCIVSVEPDGRKRPLLIFANAPEHDVPKEGDTGVLYFGPGIHRPESGVVEVKSNQTVYLAGGAVLEGTIRVKDAANVTICGRGVLSGNRWEWRQGPGYMIDIVDSRNIRIDGIVVRGAPRWTIVPTGSEKVTVSNVKICNSAVKYNDDGINPVNSRHVIVRDCFIRTADDCIAVKGKNREWGNVEDILVENSIMWTDFARVVLLGHESGAVRMGNIIFQNLDIVHHGGHDQYRWPIFFLEPAGEMMLEDVLFENIRINGGQPYQEIKKGLKWFAVIRPVITRFNKEMTFGRIERVTFKDITLNGGKGWYSILVEDVSGIKSRVQDIMFDNVRIQEELITEDSPAFIRGVWGVYGNKIKFR